MTPEEGAPSRRQIVQASGLAKRHTARRLESDVMEKYRFSDLPSSSLPKVSMLIEAIGDPHFGRSLLNVLHPLCDTEHCSVFQLNDGRPVPMIAASMAGPNLSERESPYLKRVWRTDPMFPEARDAAQSHDPIMLRSAVEGMFDASTRDLVYGPINVGERNLICGNVSGTMLTLCIPRPKGKASMSRKAVRDLFSIASPLLSIIGTHLRISADRGGLFSALSSISHIQNCISATDAGLSRREAEVCSRILFGISSAGIALELAISEETVATYRKRAYQRLAIGSKHELLQWYFDQWGGTPVANGFGRSTLN